VMYGCNIVVSFADDRPNRPYLDGSAHVGQCRPSPLAGALQHLQIRPRSDAGIRELPAHPTGDRGPEGVAG
jgi:hypothetical protein